MSLKSRSRSRGGSLTSASGGFRMTYKDYFGNVALNSANPSTHNSIYSSYDGETISDKVCYSTGSLVKHGPYPDVLKNVDPSYKQVVHTKRVTTRTAGNGFSYSHPNPAPYQYAILERPGGTYIGDARCPSDMWVDTNISKLVDPKALPASGTPRVSHSVALTKMKEMLDDNNLLGFDDFSLPTFVAELKDVRRLLDLFKIKYGDDKDLSDKFLNMEFGALPLVSDVYSILKRLSKLPNSIELWNQIAARQGTMNVHRTLDMFEKTIDYTYETGLSSYGPLKYKTGYEVKGVFKTKMIASIYFRPLPIAEGDYFELYRNIWGADSILTAVWNFLPFSFVFDWFIRIGDAIDQFERSAPVLRTTILASGYSVKQNFDAVAQEFVIVNGQRYNQDTVKMNSKRYIRTEVAPASIINADRYYNFGNYIGEVGLYHASISSALLHQHLRS